MIIEFHPGSTILIPSAIVTHFNMPVGENETRFSFTQYTAGGLFGWVDNKFMTVARCKETLTEQEWKARVAADANRWSFRLGLLPTLA